MKHLCNYRLNRWLPLQSISTPLQETSTPITPSLIRLFFVNAFLIPVQFDQTDLYHRHVLEILSTKSFFFFFKYEQQENKEPQNADMKLRPISREPRLSRGHASSTVLIKEAYRPST